MEKTLVSLARELKANTLTESNFEYLLVCYADLFDHLMLDNANFCELVYKKYTVNF